MPSVFKNQKTGSQLKLIIRESTLGRYFYGRDQKDVCLTIAWNLGPDQKVNIDGVAYEFKSKHLLCLMVNQTFEFEHPETIIAWQFNREFYCIVDHDKEVGCVGFLFYGSSGPMFIHPDPSQEEKLKLLLKVFQEEFETADTIQGDMLRMLLKRLIIIITRLAKQQFLDSTQNDTKLDLIRKFNLLVELNFKNEKSVQFYADQMYKSPKTLANLFATYQYKSPKLIIQDRLLLEAKRLLQYTDKTVKEIAYELGFEDAAYFSNFFRKKIGFSPSEFKNQHVAL